MHQKSRAVEWCNATIITYQLRRCFVESQLPFFQRFLFPVLFMYNSYCCFIYRRSYVINFYSLDLLLCKCSHRFRRSCLQLSCCAVQNFQLCDVEMNKTIEKMAVTVRNKKLAVVALVKYHYAANSGPVRRKCSCLFQRQIPCILCQTRRLHTLQIVP